MININDYKQVKLIDIAKIERAKKGIVYDKGTILIQVSATDGQVLYLEEVSEISTKYAVVIPLIEYNPYYIVETIKRSFKRFLHENQTGMNLQMDALNTLTIDVHNDIDTQNYIANTMKEHEANIKREEEIINQLKEMKRYYLGKLFASE